MRSTRITSLVVIVGLLVGGLLVQAGMGTSSPDGVATSTVEAGVAIPAARVEPTLSSTWYCAGGTATAGGFADHVLLLANPTDRVRSATVTVITGGIAKAPAPVSSDAGSAPTSAPESTSAGSSSVAAPTARSAPTSKQVPLPAQSRVEVRVGDIAAAPLAGAVVEVDGGEVVVEHQVTGSLGRATAPCSTTASASWSFPWGVTSRGARELLVFMNPFPDDATVDVVFATDEGVRDTARFQGFIVPGRSIVGAYIDDDVTRKQQVSAHVTVRSGRLVVDRIQTFDGTDPREGITLALGVPTGALEWMYPVGETGPGLAEQVVVFNPSTEVAEVEVEALLDDPTTHTPPEPFELTVPPGRYSILQVDTEDRVPAGVGHALIVRSLNEVPITAERVNTAREPSPRRGVSVVSGSPLGAPTWFFPGGGPTPERDEFVVLFNMSRDKAVTFSITGLAGGQTIAVQGLQEQSIAAGSRTVIRLGDHIAREVLPIVVTASGPIVAERGLYRIGGGGISQSMGIPLARRIVVPDPLNG